MGDIKIKCPNTGEAISTGVAMDKTSFESGQISDNTVGCPACGETHTWNKDDAWIEED
jgi:hypothetical protein